MLLAMASEKLFVNLISVTIMTNYMAFASFTVIILFILVGECMNSAVINSNLQAEYCKCDNH